MRKHLANVLATLFSGLLDTFILWHRRTAEREQSSFWTTIERLPWSSLWALAALASLDGAASAELARLAALASLDGREPAESALLARTVPAELVALVTLFCRATTSSSKNG